AYQQTSGATRSKTRRRSRSRRHRAACCVTSTTLVLADSSMPALPAPGMRASCLTEPPPAAADTYSSVVSLSSPCYRRVAGGPLSVLLGDQALNHDSARWGQGHLMVGQERARLVWEQPAPVLGVPGTGVGVLRSLAEPATLTPAAWRGRTRGWPAPTTPTPPPAGSKLFRLPASRSGSAHGWTTSWATTTAAPVPTSAPIAASRSP